MGDRHIRVSIALGILSAILAFPFLSSKAIDWCGYESFCGRNISIAFLIGLSLSLILAVVIGWLCFFIIGRVL